MPHQAPTTPDDAAPETSALDDAAAPATDDAGSLTVPARLVLFGHDPVETTVRVIPRSTSWRFWRTARVSAVFLLITPIVGIIPPHAPWVAGALTAAIVLGRRRWTERFSVAAFKASCPRCGQEVTLKPGARLKIPQPISCDGCGHEPLLHASLTA